MKKRRIHPTTFELRPNKTQRVLTWLSHGFLFVAIGVTGYPWLFKLLLACLVVLSFVRCFRARPKVIKIYCDQAVWKLTFEDGSVHLAEMLYRRYVTRVLTVMNFKLIKTGKNLSLPVSHLELNDPEYRYLRALLTFGIM
ncbi:MAG: protein YgfX [Gammaproteobacteria bacterium]